MSSHELIQLRHCLESAFGTRPFTFAEATARGIGAHRLRAAMTLNVITRLRRGVYRVREANTPSTLGAPERDAGKLLDVLSAHIDDLRQRGHEPIIGGKSAAQLWGIPWVGDADVGAVATPTLIVRPSPHLRKGRRGHVLLRFDSLPGEHICQFHGLPISTPIRTGCDVARETARSPEAALVPLAAAARVFVRQEWQRTMGSDFVSEHDLTRFARDPQHALRIQRMVEHVIARSPRRGIRMIRQIRRLIDPRLETPLESVSCSRFAESSLPQPQLQVDVAGESGTVYRVDFLFGHVIGEADGAVKYRDGEALWREKLRQSDLEARGFIVVRWTWEEIWNRPHVVIERIRRALARSHSGAQP